MNLFSDNLAKKYNISRKDQDYFAYCSHLKAIAAQNNSVFDEEITVVENISQDEGISFKCLNIDLFFLSFSDDEIKYLLMGVGLLRTSSINLHGSLRIIKICIFAQRNDHCGKCKSSQ